MVANLVRANAERAKELRQYTSMRHYSVAYRGFPKDVAATMDVQATFDAPSTKTFRIVSQSGSKLLIGRVLKKLLETEEEAAKNPEQSALTPANYTFQLLGTEEAGAERLYVLHVEPRMESKYLYRGKIWVDAHDFAVTRIVAEPAKDPSFWIKQTDIHHIYEKVGRFWLPERNQSETHVRGGGTATLTIEYSNYHVNGSE